MPIGLKAAKHTTNIVRNDRRRRKAVVYNEDQMFKRAEAREEDIENLLYFARRHLHTLRLRRIEFKVPFAKIR